MIQSLIARFAGGYFWPAMALPRNEQDPQHRSSVSFDNLRFENSFEDNGVSRQLVLDMLTLESDVFQRCLSAQPAPTAQQRFNRRECAHLLRDLVATADLPPRGALSSWQLDLTHRWWSEAEVPDIDVNDVYPPAAAYICIKLHSARYPDPAPFQLPAPQQPARSLTDLLTTLAALLDRRQPHNVPPLHSARTVHEVVDEEYRILESVNYELGTYTRADWVSLFEVRFFLVGPATSAALSAGDLLTALAHPLLVFGQAGPCASSMTVSGTAHALWTPRHVASGARHGSSHV